MIDISASYQPLGSKWINFNYVTPNPKLTLNQTPKVYDFKPLKYILKKTYDILLNGFFYYFLNQI